MIRQRVLVDLQTGPFDLKRIHFLQIKNMRAPLRILLVFDNDLSGRVITCWSVYYVHVSNAGVELLYVLIVMIRQLVELNLL